MGIPFTKEDKSGITMPEIFTYLASRIDNREIDFEKIEKATELLSEQYDTILLEGARGYRELYQKVYP